MVVAWSGLWEPNFAKFVEPNLPWVINCASRSVHPMPIEPHRLAYKGLRQAPMADRPSGHFRAFMGQFMRGKGHLAHGGLEPGGLGHSGLAWHGA
jgi:hypothetical protein